MDRDAVRRWIENYRAVAQREMAESRDNPLTAQQAIDASMALLRFDESINGDPFSRDDPVTRREDEQLWQAWVTLRRRWRDGR